MPGDPSTHRIELLDELLSNPVALHGWDEDATFDWHLDVDAVRFLYDNVAPGSRTLETGCGYSTLALVLAGAEHTAVSPWPEEHRRIRRWCEERGVDAAGLSCIAALSQDALPGLEGPLDLVLVDGDHSFPVPFIDWYYAANRLRTGGLLIVDDLQVRTGHLLDQHLSSDVERWRLVTRFPTTVVYRRLDGPLVPEGSWTVQPFTMRPVRSVVLRRWAHGVRRDGVIPRLRNTVRLRSRVRARRSGSSR